MNVLNVKHKKRSWKGMLCGVLGLMSISPVQADFLAAESRRADFVRQSRAAHFLSQATMGGTHDEVLALADRIEAIGLIPACEEWIDHQFTIPRGATLRQTSTATSNNARGNALFYQGWMGQAINAEDQLRFRVGWALSQIFVVGDSYWQGLDHRAGRYLRHVDFHDQLLRRAFSSHRTILEEVTYHPFMGAWLTYVSNSRTIRNNQGEIISIPDQNFAREIMQLFTVGVFSQNQFGDFQFDAGGNPIENYTAEDIEEFSEVFTGISFNDSRGFFNKSATIIPFGRMRTYDAHHDRSTKVLLRRTLPANQSTRQDVTQALNDLAFHPSTAPYFSRLLMKRLTSSNPSREYVKRVTDAWNGEGPYGNETVGSMRAVIKAILLDPEARLSTRFVPDRRSNLVETVHREDLDVQGFRGVSLAGKVKEPMLKLTHLFRFFGANVRDDSNRDRISSTNITPIQRPANSPTVFNFFSEAHAPSDGAIGEALIRWENNFNEDILIEAPEIQILGQNVIPEFELLVRLLNSSNNANGRGNANLLHLDTMTSGNFLANDSGFIRYLNIMLCNGKLPQSVANSIDANFDFDGGNDRAALIQAINLIMSSAAYSVTF